MPIDHRLKFGVNVKNAYRSIHLVDPNRIPEDDFSVCDYPEDFVKDRIPTILKRYKKKHPDCMPAPVKRKRKRIDSQVQKVGIQ